MSARLAAVLLVVVVGLPILVLAAVAGAATSVIAASSPTPTALADIPPDYLALYRQAAATCPGLDWSVLAAVGKVETDHGRSPLPGVRAGENSAGAAGPMQFLAPTFADVVAHHPLPPGGATPSSRYNPHDAIHAAAHYLCDQGARNSDLNAALFAYNHSQTYVRQVLDQARAYAAAPTTGTGDCNALTASTPAAFAAINYACGQRGLPYLWGGDGPERGDAGFDCSGLTTAAYAAAGIPLPRTAQTQYLAGPPVPEGMPLLPGDLLFYGTPGTPTTARIHHVALYLGAGQMINAPRFGHPVQVESYRWNGDDYAGATRPSAASPPRPS
ncbi:C40 family peptidase [uncultured Pseudonocardia sp.]|uniref:C40 family peptidase n=1 Tax=uncultured Pseudonocardia sp. TaxID=211455 RepID=UPI0026071732|nr:bifunctional lytic transglycosylase/C40 family peptidase [uncultured Pseudonocardia sp.]